MISLKNILIRAYPDEPALFSGPDVTLTGISCDSRKVENGNLFVAVRGARQDGNEFIGEAVRRGAAAVVADYAKVLSAGIPLIRVSDSRLAAARLAGAYYAYPSRAMKVLGITGTNGKTTSSFLLEHLLRSSEKKTGMLGTIHYRFGDKTIPAVETTPGPLRLEALFSEMKKEQCEFAVMEVSAHAIDQSRTAGIHFETALFTNLTQDHLDYFETMDRYFECKARFFTALSTDQQAVLNADDARVRSLKGRTPARVTTFGISSAADLTAAAIEAGLDRTHFKLRCDGESIPVELPLTGVHNVYNSLGALAVMRGLGFDLRKAAADLKNFPGVPGRLERVDRGQNFSVFVDYAHTPDGLDNVLKSLVAYKKGKLITVFGCGGDRDRNKRPQMAGIAGRYSDFVVVTSDNPRSENPRQIAEEIKTGFPRDFKDFTVELDRRKAIRRALLNARANDIVLLAGKGHERTQVIGKEAIPFSDREEAERVLNGR